MVTFLHFRTQTDAIHDLTTNKTSASTGAKGKLLSTIQSYFKAGQGKDGLEEHTKVFLSDFLSECNNKRRVARVL